MLKTLIKLKQVLLTEKTFHTKMNLIISKILQDKKDADLEDYKRHQDDVFIAFNEFTQAVLCHTFASDRFFAFNAFSYSMLYSVPNFKNFVYKISLSKLNNATTSTNLTKWGRDLESYIIDAYRDYNTGLMHALFKACHSFYGYGYSVIKIELVCNYLYKFYNLDPNNCLLRVNSVGDYDVIIYSELWSYSYLYSLKLPYINMLKKTSLFLSHQYSEKLQAINLIKDINLKKTEFIDTVQFFIDAQNHSYFSNLDAKINSINLIKKMDNYSKEPLLAFTKQIEDAQLLQKTISNNLCSLFFNKLDKSNLVNFFKDIKNDHKVIKEIYLQRYKRDTTRIKNNPISKLASEIIGLQNTLRNNLSSLGFYTPYLKEYIFKQTHSKKKLIKDGYDKWSNFIKPLIKIDNMSLNLDDNLRSIYKNLISENLPYNASGVPSSLFQRKNRKLHFSSPYNAYLYNATYGNYSSLYDNIIGTIDSFSKKVAIARKFGLNPMKTKMLFEKHIVSSGDATLINKLIKDKSGAILTNEKLFNYMMGSNNYIANESVYTFGKWLRSFTNWASLLGGFPSAVLDGCTMVVGAKVLGFGTFKILEEVIKSYFSINKKDKAFIKDLGIFATNSLRGMVSMYSLDDFSLNTKTLNWLNDKFYKLNLLSTMDSINRQSSGIVLSRHVNKISNKNFKELPIHFQNFFLTSGMDELDWEIVKFLKDKEHINPGLIFKIDDSVIKELLKKKNKTINDVNINEYKANSYFNILNFMQNVVCFTNPMPSDKVISLLKGYTQDGTVLSEVFKSISQLKSYTASLTLDFYQNLISFSHPQKNQTSIPQTFFDTVTFKQPADVYKNIAMFVSVSLLLGYCVTASLCVLKGVEIPGLYDLTMEAYRRSDPFALASYVIPDYNAANPYQSLISTPSLVFAGNSFNLLRTILKGDTDKNQAAFENYLKRWTPGHKVFYIQPLLQEGVYNELFNISRLYH